MTQPSIRIGWTIFIGIFLCSKQAEISASVDDMSCKPPTIVKPGTITWSVRAYMEPAKTDEVTILGKGNWRIRAVLSRQEESSSEDEDDLEADNKKFFYSKDTDGDKFVDKSEMRKWYVAYFANITNEGDRDAMLDEYVEMTFNTTDSNRDNKISYTEQKAERRTEGLNSQLLAFAMRWSLYPVSLDSTDSTSEPTDPSIEEEE